MFTDEMTEEQQAQAREAFDAFRAEVITVRGYQRDRTWVAFRDKAETLTLSEGESIEHPVRLGQRLRGPVTLRIVAYTDGALEVTELD